MHENRSKKTSNKNFIHDAFKYFCYSSLNIFLSIILNEFALTRFLFYKVTHKDFLRNHNLKKI